MKTFFLIPETWDLAIDTQGNIAIATDVYQQAQDISTSCRVFYGDDYYNRTDGIPYLQKILGKHNYPMSLFQRNLHDRSMLVNGVVSVDVNLYPLENRIMRGTIDFTNDQNSSGTVGL